MPYSNPDSSVSNHDMNSVSPKTTTTNNTSPFATLASTMGKTTIDPETETEHNQGEGNDDQEITINGKQQHWNQLPDQFFM